MEKKNEVMCNTGKSRVKLMMRICKNVTIFSHVIVARFYEKVVQADLSVLLPTSQRTITELCKGLCTVSQMIVDRKGRASDFESCEDNAMENNISIYLLRA